MKAKQQHRVDKKSRGTRRGRTYRHGVPLWRGLPLVSSPVLGMTGSRLLSLLLVLVMTVLLAWFFLDPAFFVYGVEIQDNALVDTQSVFRAAALDGMSVFYIDPSAVAEDIVRRLPNVSQAEVTVELPSRVSIRIAEKDVRFVWQSAGAAFLVDGEGRVLKPADGSQTQLLSIHDLDERALQPGGQVELAALRAVEELHRLLPEIKAFDYSRAKGVSLYDTRGWPIYFGNEEGLQEKVASFQAVMVKILSRGEKPKFIDLRFAGSAYYE
ncbi:MAG: FtsQ-type POTRA domain-containing protein [Chloroflexi bacterium]|nr:FtsQ-type POTRA domain-containing protein [Chloroflexota bacterium]